MKNVGAKTWLVVALIFLVGAITGAALTVGLRSEWMHPPGAKQMQRHWMEYLTQQLDLTTDQQAKIGDILSSAGNKMKGVHEDEVRRISSIFKETDSQIEPLLTADQQTKYAHLREDREKDLAHHMHRGRREDGPPDGPGGPPPGPHGA